LACGVVLAGGLAVVPGRTVGLHDQALRGPAEVGNEPAPVENERDVDVRVGKPAAQEEFEHNILQFAACWSGTCGDDRCELSGAPARPEAIEGREQLADVDALQRLRLANGATQRAHVEHAGEVDQRPRRRGNPDSSVVNDVRRLQHARTVNSQPAMRADRRARHHDVETAIVPVDETP
jgi:hypothetical protein